MQTIADVEPDGPDTGRPSLRCLATPGDEWGKALADGLRAFVTDPAPCTCHVGPGKFEGESALAALAYESMMLGGADVTTYEGEDGPATDWFRAPLGFDADEETVQGARDAGFCELHCGCARGPGWGRGGAP